MTYNEFINNIIKERGQWNIPKGEYFERHHIIPKCMGGKGHVRQKHDNIIWLTAREHFIAHKLLVEENPGNRKLLYAFAMMSTLKNKVIFTSEEYEELRIAHVNSQKGKFVSESTKQKIRESHLGTHLSEESKRKVSAFNKGKVVSEETRKKISASKKGVKKPPEMMEALRLSNIGRKRTEEVRRNMSKAQKGRKHSEETKQKIREGNLGCKNPMWGKHPSEETRKKLSESHKGFRWFNNGTIAVKSKECPEGFVKGKLSNIEWLLPDGTIRKMDRANAHRYHPDWVEIIGDIKR